MHENKAGTEHAKKKRGQFKDLVAAEAEVFRQTTPREPIVAPAPPSKEPWVAFTTRDLVGLAFSGGGIRSATFNLGILQGLAEKNIITKIDYLATVSGGGYAGGFWTRWRRWQADKNLCDASFPTAPQAPELGHLKEVRESAQLRHLREFSRFLIPRKGLNGEFWSVVISILSGIIPSLIAALASVLLLTTVWALVAAGLTGPHGLVAGVLSAIFVGAILYFLLPKAFDGTDEKGALKEKLGLPRWFYSLLTSSLYLGCWVLLLRFKGKDDGVLGWSPFSIFAPCVALMGALAVLTVLRLFISRHLRPHPLKTEGKSGNSTTQAANSKRLIWSSCLTRSMGYLLAIQVLWALMAGLWLVAAWFCAQAQDANKSAGVGGLTGLALTFSFLFYKLRDWLKQQKESSEDSPLSKALKVLKPYVPLLLANGVVLLLFLLAAITLASLRPDMHSPLYVWSLTLGCCAGLLLAVFYLFDPAGQGLHDFYRGRLARCFLGAASESPTHQWAERDDDDMSLQDDENRPIHLVCCAANQASGDPLLTLHRGARSAVLSRHGVSVGNDWIEDDPDHPVRLSSAMTASAAAFNSLMGEFNVTLGHAVPFLMSALNLRLGLWVRNPAVGDSKWSRLYRWLPGAFFVREMLGLAGCDKNCGPYIHLSDGGHFENLALYELIRRHCRYIIVTDAAEDRDFTFADFGRAVRRVREDFGVEIEIDLTRLRSNEKGLSSQHLAIGIIHYDGVVGTDKGTLVFIKSSLTGDEPADVLQYQKQSEAFPHESTGDQFFDEAQFESYRRLGEHIVHSTLRGFEGRTEVTELPIETFFHELRLQWQVVPWIDSEDGVRLCERGAELERTLNAEENRDLGIAFLDPILPLPSAPRPDKEAKQEATAAQGREKEEILLVLGILRFMEEAFVVCALDRYWSNPRAQSWMSLLHRYAAMPVLRHRWPVLKPLLGGSFVDFANDHLALKTADACKPDQLPALAQPTFSLSEASPPRPGQYLERRFKECLPGYRLEGRHLSILRLHLPVVKNAPEQSLEVGFLAFDVEEKDGKRSLAWQIDELFIPPELKGAKFTSVLLDTIIQQAEADKSLHSLQVYLGVDKSPQAGHYRMQRSQGARQAQVEHIDFHRSRGFIFDATTWENGQNVCMEKLLHPKSA